MAADCGWVPGFLCFVAFMKKLQRILKYRFTFSLPYAKMVSEEVAKEA